MRTEAQKAAKRRYNTKVKRIAVDFYPGEKEILAFLEKQPQKATYIKELIKAEMKKERE